MHHLVGVAEIAEMLGVSRQRVNKIVTDDESFPGPEAELKAGRIWTREAIELWARERGRRIEGQNPLPVRPSQPTITPDTDE